MIPSSRVRRSLQKKRINQKLSRINYKSNRSINRPNPRILILNIRIRFLCLSYRVPWCFSLLIQIVSTLLFHLQGSRYDSIYSKKIVPYIFFNFVKFYNIHSCYPWFLIFVQYLCLNESLHVHKHSHKHYLLYLIKISKKKTKTTFRENPIWRNKPWFHYILNSIFL